MQQLEKRFVSGTNINPGEFREEEDTSFNTEKPNPRVFECKVDILDFTKSIRLSYTEKVRLKNKFMLRSVIQNRIYHMFCMQDKQIYKLITYDEPEHNYPHK